jgi:hypothetical protein
MMPVFDSYERLIKKIYCANCLQTHVYMHCALKFHVPYKSPLVILRRGYLELEDNVSATSGTDVFLCVCVCVCVCYISSKWKLCDGPTLIRGFLPRVNKYQTSQNGGTCVILANIEHINIQGDSVGRVSVFGGDSIDQRHKIFI